MPDLRSKNNNIGIELEQWCPLALLTGAICDPAKLLSHIIYKFWYLMRQKSVPFLIVYNFACD